MAYEMTGDEKYAEWHQMIHDWTFRCFPDAEHGNGLLSAPRRKNIQHLKPGSCIRSRHESINRKERGTYVEEV